jgi:hypothetical protein
VNTPAFTIGQAVTWLYEPRGGYGYTIPVDGLVTKIGPKRVQIEIRKASGELVRRWVTPDRLRGREVRE